MPVPVEVPTAAHLELDEDTTGASNSWLSRQKNATGKLIKQLLMATNGDLSDGEFEEDEVTNTSTSLAQMLSSAPLGSKVSEPIIKLIKTNKFVDFRKLLLKDTVDPSKVDSVHINTYQEWAGAWHLFFHFYVQAFPEQALQANKHAFNVLRLSKSHGGLVFRYYDEILRIHRASQPAQVPLGTLNSEVLTSAQVAAAQGSTSHTFRASGSKGPSASATGSGSSANGHCFRYNSSTAYCGEPTCRYSHTCKHCSKPHPAFRCPTYNAPANNSRANYYRGNNNNNNNNSYARGYNSQQSSTRGYNSEPRPKAPYTSQSKKA